MGQSKAHQWIHVLLVVLQATLRMLGDAPSRSLTALAQRIGVAEANATTGVGSPTTSHLPVQRQRRHSPPPFGHDGTERRIERRQDPTE